MTPRSGNEFRNKFQSLIVNNSNSQAAVLMYNQSSFNVESMPDMKQFAYNNNLKKKSNVKKLKALAQKGKKH